MTRPALGDVTFCHLAVGVTDTDRALSFHHGARLQRGPAE
jgi:hypothetical protein